MVSKMQRLMQVADEMNQDDERLTLLRDIFRFVKYARVAFYLSSDAFAVRTSRSRLAADSAIFIVPPRCAGVTPLECVAVVVHPSRNRGEIVIAQYLTDFLTSGVAQQRRRDIAGDSMAVIAPRVSIVSE